MLPVEQRNMASGELALVVAIAGGPTQAILRPSEIERPSLAEALLREAMFGAYRLFDTGQGSRTGVEGEALVLTQQGNSIVLDPMGGLTIRQALQEARAELLIIQDEVELKLRNALHYAAWVLDHVDRTQRITHVVPAAMIEGGAMRSWRTRAEHGASRGSYSINMDSDPGRVANLIPPNKPRAALSHQASAIVEDLVTLLKRPVQRGRR